ncbi:hypothetical protein GOP47_0023933 [Adiantum capillus-veneris]|uniref:Uncharacterized protein n=1 Tax=Adiantum capillus-veneris TaxID=13818 RepID=A0A9D4U5L8_ADICA|nr:hypothetical protein GOP47_0023933 [Adiantum capillus-veneris]
MHRFHPRSASPTIVDRVHHGALSPLKLVSNGNRVSMSVDGKKEINLAALAALVVLDAVVLPDMGSWSITLAEETPSV